MTPNVKQAKKEPQASITGNGKSAKSESTVGRKRPNNKRVVDSDSEEGDLYQSEAESEKEVIRKHASSTRAFKIVEPKSSKNGRKICDISSDEEESSFSEEPKKLRYIAKGAAPTPDKVVPKSVRKDSSLSSESDQKRKRELKAEQKKYVEQPNKIETKPDSTIHHKEEVKPSPVKNKEAEYDSKKVVNVIVSSTSKLLNTLMQDGTAKPFLNRTSPPFPSPPKESPKPPKATDDEPMSLADRLKNIVKPDQKLALEQVQN